MSYIVEAGEIPNREEFKEIIKTGLSEVDEVKIMTLAEQYRQEGYQQGVLQGIEKGVLQGMEKGKMEGILQGLEKGKVEGKLETIGAIITAMDLFAQKVCLEEISRRTGLSVAELEVLKRKIH